MPAAVSQVSRSEGDSTTMSENHNVDSASILTMKSASPLVGKRRKIGLENIGNTCYMNATIQAVRTIAPLFTYFSTDAITSRLHELQRDAKTAPVSVAFASLLRDLERTKRSAIEPTKFAEIFSEVCPQFEPGQQHDAHECVLRLLDCLHEELQPRTRTPKSNNQGVPTVVSNLFRGEFSSTVKCVDCHTVSRTVEPFYGVSVPLCNAASRETRSMTISHVSYELVAASNEVGFDLRAVVSPVTLSLRATMRHAIHVLQETFRSSFITNSTANSARLKVYSAAQLALVSIDKRGLVTWHDPAVGLDDSLRYTILDVPLVQLDLNEKGSCHVSFPVDETLKNSAHVMETRVCQCLVQPAHFRPQRCSYCDMEAADLARCSKCRNAAYCSGDCQKNDLDKHRAVCFEQTDVIGLPFVLRAALPAHYSASVGRTLNDVLERFALASVSVNFEPADLPPQAQPNATGQRRLFKPVRLHGSDRYTHVSKSVGEHAFRIESSYSEAGSKCDVPTVMLSEAPKVRISLVIWWQNRLYPITVANNPSADAVWKFLPSCSESAPSGCRQKTNGDAELSLTDCLDAFVEEELLKEGDAWHCPRCATKRAALKSIRFAKLPDVLVLQLKRFRNSYVVRKLPQRVDYPLRQLDLARYCVSSCQSASDDTEESRYDLAAVIEHHGHSLIWGHYTAICSESTADGNTCWTRFDDSLVQPILDANRAAARADAYVLFYVRHRQAPPQRIEYPLSSNSAPDSLSTPAATLSSSSTPGSTPCPDSAQVPNSHSSRTSTPTVNPDLTTKSATSRNTTNSNTKAESAPMSSPTLKATTSASNGSSESYRAPIVVPTARNAAVNNGTAAHYSDDDTDMNSLD